MNPLSFRHTLLAAISAVSFLTGCMSQPSRDKVDQEQGALLEKAGALSQQDYVKTRKLMDGAESAPIPEKDIAWTCSLVKGRHVSDKGGPQLFLSVGSVLVRNNGAAPAGLRPQYFTIGQEMVRNTESDTGTRDSVAELGLIVLAKSRDKAAANLVRPFLTNPQTKDTAIKAMQVLQ